MATKLRQISEFLIPLLLLLAVMAFFFIRKDSNRLEENEFSDYEFPAFQTLELQLSKENINKIRGKRDRAIQDGVLITNDDSWVSGNMREGIHSFPIKLRLKGDWTDHLEGNKWSFRIAIRDSGAWRGMEEFSIQNPKTRDFLREWLFHKALQKEGILSPRYDFIQVRLNGARLGIYAIEEHFSKQLIESQARREGTLVKFDESGLWEARHRMKDQINDLLDPIYLYNAAHNLPFKKSKIISDSLRRTEFNVANQLAHQYRYALAPPAEIVDINLFAKYFALVDLFRAYHNLIWHNIRLYFNPITQKLEPVGFDAFSGTAFEQLVKGPFLGFACNGNTRYGNRLDLLGTIFYRDSSFVEYYYQYLDQYSSTEYVTKLLKSMENEIQARESFIRREFLTYLYSRNSLRQQANRIQTALKKSIRKDLIKIEKMVLANGQIYHCIQNYNPIAIRIGIKDAKSKSTKFLSAYDSQNPAEFVELIVKEGQHLFYKIPGTGEAQVLK